MANVNIGCGASGIGNPQIIIPDQTFDIIDGLSTKVIKTTQGSKRIYKINLNLFTTPNVSINHNPIVIEVGASIASGNVRFTVNEGSEPIVSIVSLPDENPVNVGIEKDIPFTNLTRTTVGLGNQINLDITDDNAVLTQVSIGIPFKLRMFQGFSSMKGLNESQIENLEDLQGNNGSLADTIGQLYNGKKTYNQPDIGFNRHFYWLGPVGTTIPTGATFNNLPLPLVIEPNVIITNSFSIIQEYWQRRTAIGFGFGNFDITLS